MEVWLDYVSNLHDIAKEKGDAAMAYQHLLGWMFTKGYIGACHDTSVMLYILFAEMGYETELCMGEVRFPTGAVSDHSWVLLDGKICDCAIALQNIEEHSHDPIFLGESLRANREVYCEYGVYYEGVVEDESTFVLNSSVGDYLKVHSMGETWFYEFVCQLGRTVGIELSPGDIRDKYGALKRTYVTPTLA